MSITWDILLVKDLFITSLLPYGLVCFYNKCALIKVAPKVHSDGIITPTNFTTQKLHCIPHRVKHISATNQLRHS